MSKQLKKER